MAPIQYELLMKAFGQANTLQSSAQTGDPLDESAQTEAIATKNKATQHPRVYSAKGMEDHGEDIESSKPDEGVGKIGSLSAFMKRASQVVIRSGL